jgi:hypothetical protein
MRCESCDGLLSDYEATRKNLRLEFVGLCNDCLSSSDLDDVFMLDRPDLKHADDDLTHSDGLPYPDDITTKPGGSDEL